MPCSTPEKYALILQQHYYHIKGNYENSKHFICPSEVAEKETPHEDSVIMGICFKYSRCTQTVTARGSNLEK